MRLRNRASLVSMVPVRMGRSPVRGSCATDRLFAFNAESDRETRARLTVCFREVNDWVKKVGACLGYLPTIS